MRTPEDPSSAADGVSASEAEADPAKDGSHWPPGNLPSQLADPAIAARIQLSLLGLRSADPDEWRPAPARKVLVREGGVWSEDKKRTAANLQTWHASDLRYFRDIHDTITHFKQLVENPALCGLFPVHGLPSTAAAAQIVQNGARRTRLRRSKSTSDIVDAAKHPILLDGDGLPVPSRLLEDVPDYPDYPAIVAALPRICEWLAWEVLPECFHDVTVFAYPTAKHGLINLEKASLRLGFWSQRPLNYAERKALVAWLDRLALERVPEWCAHAEANPTWKPFDDSVCSPEHICFTAAPELIDCDALGEDYAPPYKRELIELLGGSNEVILPAEAYATSDHIGGKRSPRRRAPQDASQGQAAPRPARRTAPDLFNGMGPDNYYELNRDVIGKSAVQTPAHRVDETLEFFIIHAADKIRATSPSEQVEERIARHLNPSELRRSWDGATYGRQARLGTSGAKYNYPVVKADQGPPVSDLATARARLADFFAEHLQREQAFLLSCSTAALNARLAPHTVMLGSVGLGKSSAFRRTIDRLDIERTLTVYFVPDHNLGDEMLELMRAAVPADKRHLIRLHKGRRQEGMCLEPEFGRRAREAEKLELSPLEHVCPPCPLRATCKWAAQHDDWGPGIIIMPHSYMLTQTFRAMVRGSEKAPIRFVVDEFILGTFLDTDAAKLLPIDRLGVDDALFADLERAWQDRKISLPFQTDFVEHRQKLIAGLVANPGPLVAVNAALLADIDKRLELERTFRRYLIRRKGEVFHERQSAPRGERRTLAKRLIALRRLHVASRTVSRILMLVAACLKAPARQTIFGLRLIRSKAGVSVRAMQRAKLPDIFTSIPGEWLDATGDPDICRVLIGPGVDLALCEVRARPVNYNLTQVVGRSFATSQFVPWQEEDGTDAEAARTRKKRCDSNQDRLDRFVVWASWRYRGKGSTSDVLLIVPKKLRKAIEGKRPKCLAKSIRGRLRKKLRKMKGRLPERLRKRKARLPQNVAILNFGKERGIDAYRDVPCLIVCGRDMPPMPELELMTEALHWDNPSVTSIQYVSEWPTAERKIGLAGGDAIAVVNEWHPDPHVAQLQRQIAHAKIEQGIGRARLVMRSMERPCDVYLFGQMGTSTPAHQIINWCDADRDLAEIMLAAGVVFSNADSIARAFPTLIPAADARRKEAAAYAWHRVITGAAFGALTMYRTSFELRPPELRLGSFRMTSKTADGRSSYKQDVLIDVTKYTDPRAAIAVVLGVDTACIKWLGWKQHDPIRSPASSGRWAGIVSNSTMVVDL